MRYAGAVVCISVLLAGCSKRDTSKEKILSYVESYLTKKQLDENVIATMYFMQGNSQEISKLQLSKARDTIKSNVAFLNNDSGPAEVYNWWIVAVRSNEHYLALIDKALATTQKPDLNADDMGIKELREDWKKTRNEENEAFNIIEPYANEVLNRLKEQK